MITSPPVPYSTPLLLDLQDDRRRNVVVALLALVEGGHGKRAVLARDESGVVFVPGVELALELDRPLAVRPLPLRQDIGAGANFSPYGYGGPGCAKAGKDGSGRIPGTQVRADYHGR